MNKFDVYLKDRAKLVEKNLSKYISKIKKSQEKSCGFMLKFFNLLLL